MTQYVYRFGGGVDDKGEGNKNLLGGKGANLDGMAAIGLPGGRWVGCNAFPEHACASRRDAERMLKKLVKRGRRGCVGEWRCAPSA